MKLTPRAQAYLRCIDDWKAPYEIAALIGDTPPPTTNDIKRMLGRLAARGLVKYYLPNNTYRMTDEGRSALQQYAPS